MAYDDIATLGIRADTSNLSKAISKLEELKNAAQKTETATEQFRFFRLKDTFDKKRGHGLQSE